MADFVAREVLTASTDSVGNNNKEKKRVKKRNFLIDERFIGIAKYTTKWMSLQFQLGKKSEKCNN
jgi:hypothetical protein